ncbi:hypothetical protein [Antarcticimicrobium luteum]|uniref:Phage tail protein n=1 Tax=Antarcticimicrobium luteum TaxID=2547397 RepID=A0A4R5VGS0_9RHOB|nr:hypothetical protein [Antarcticimicrobium luteum]TDK51138.1 hypothetical protein E1832_03980 [Antarcticimicrobium luteum]
MDGFAIPADLVTVEWSLDDVDLNFAPIPGIDTVFIPEVTQEWRDRTTLNTPGRFKQYGKGLKDTSEGTIGCFYSKELWEQAAAMSAQETPIYIRVTFPPDPDQTAGDVFKYATHIIPSLPSTDKNGDMRTDLKLRPTGAIAWVKGALA